MPFSTISHEKLVNELLLMNPNMSEENQNSWIRENYGRYRLCSDIEINQLFAAMGSQRMADLSMISEADYESAIKQSTCPFCPQTELEVIDFHRMVYVTHAALDLFHAKICSKCCRIFNIEYVAMFPA